MLEMCSAASNGKSNRKGLKEAEERDDLIQITRVGGRRCRKVGRPAPPLFPLAIFSMLSLVLMLITSGAEAATPPSLTSMLPAAGSRKGAFPVSGFPRPPWGHSADISLMRRVSHGHHHQQQSSLQEDVRSETTVIGLREGTRPRPGEHLLGLTRIRGDRAALSSHRLQASPAAPVRAKLMQENPVQLV